MLANVAAAALVQDSRVEQAGRGKNNSMPCVQAGEEHTKLSHEEFAAWSRAINKEKSVRKAFRSDNGED